jgi:prepilin-type N-terminal cleavage/methylation domain-containing protein
MSADYLCFSRPIPFRASSTAETAVSRATLYVRRLQSGRSAPSSFGMKPQTKKRIAPLPDRGNETAGHRAGLSLIELLIVIAIVVILGLILLTVFAKTWKLVQSWRSDAAPQSQIGRHGLALASSCGGAGHGQEYQPMPPEIGGIHSGCFVRTACSVTGPSNPESRRGQFEASSTPRPPRVATLAS